MTIVPEDPGHVHDRRYPSLDHIHDERYYTEDETDRLVQDAVITDHSLLTNLDKDDHPQYTPFEIVSGTDPVTVPERPGLLVVRTDVEVDEGLEFLQKQGGTMTGPLLLQGLPSSDNEAASMQYVDNCIMEQPGSAENHSLTTCRLYRSGGMVHAEINGSVSITPGTGTPITGTISDQFLPPASLGDVFLTITVYSDATAYVASISNALPYIRWRGVTFPQGTKSIVLNASWPVRVD